MSFCCLSFSAALVMQFVTFAQADGELDPDPRVNVEGDQRQAFLIHWRSLSILRRWASSLRVRSGSWLIAAGVGVGEMCTLCSCSSPLRIRQKPSRRLALPL